MYIRPIEPRDYSEALTIQNSFWTPETSPVFNKIWTKKDITARLGKRSNMLVAIKEHRIAGVLSYCLYYSFEQGQHVATFGVIVHPDFAKQGIAKQLIQHFISLAPTLDYKKISMHVTGGNIPAIKLYEILNFTLEACLKNQLHIKRKYHDDLTFGLWLEEKHD